jgi:branched-chain amino acid transport system substrate-binding protein
VRRRAALGLLLAGVLLAGCSSSEQPGAQIRGHLLTVYFSGPMQGPSSLGAVAALNGAQMALDQARARIGSYRIRLRALDDSTVQSDGWDPNQTTLGARLATQDPTTIGYIGDLNSGASAISIPLLNRFEIPQISPGSSAVGLTTAGPGAAPGEPEKYYPTGRRTFARVVPTDASQAEALVVAERAEGCRSTFVLNDGEVDGEDAALTFLLTAQSAGQRIVGIQAFQRQAADYTGLARSVAASGVDCVLISALDEASAVRLTQQLALTLPHATIFATSGLADAAYLNPDLGGLPTSLDSRVIVVSPALPASHYPRRGRAFLASYAQRYGAVAPPAIFGYDAMNLMLWGIRRATDGGHAPAERSKVLDELFSGRSIHGAIGTFHIDKAGDTSIRSYAIYRVTGGRLVFMAAVGGAA